MYYGIMVGYIPGDTKDSFSYDFITLNYMRIMILITIFDSIVFDGKNNRSLFRSCHLKIEQNVFSVNVLA